MGQAKTGGNVGEPHDDGGSEHDLRDEEPHASTAWLYEMRARRARTATGMQTCHADTEGHQG